MSKDKAREFWIDNSKEKGDFFLYNVIRGVNNYNFEGAIHVIEFAAYAALEAKIAECVAALTGVIAVADRNTKEFNYAREVLEKVKK